MHRTKHYFFLISLFSNCETVPDVKINVWSVLSSNEFVFLLFNLSIGQVLKVFLFEQRIIFRHFLFMSNNIERVDLCVVTLGFVTQTVTAKKCVTVKIGQVSLRRNPQLKI